jgi:Acetyltransferases
MLVREALQQDAQSIVEFQLKMARETEGLHLDAPTVQKGVAAVFEDAAKGAYYVAEAEGQVIASLMITREWSDWRHGWVWWFQSVYVLPEYRKAGVFAAMYQFIKEKVRRSDDVRGLRLYVDKRNLPAQAVYTRQGMNGSHYLTYEWMVGDESE